MINTVTINLINGVPVFRKKQVILTNKLLRLLKMNGKSICIWVDDLVYLK